MRIMLPLAHLACFTFLIQEAKMTTFKTRFTVSINGMLKVHLPTKKKVLFNLERKMYFSSIPEMYLKIVSDGYISC